jgi:tetratricopeptide (TPR) repeat protein
VAKDLLSRYRDLGGKGPQNFTEAKEAGKLALDNMQEMMSKIKLAPITKEEARIPVYEKERDAYRSEALKMFNLALRLKDDDSPEDDVNVIRYFLTYLNYDAGNIYDAAVIGEYLARKHPNSAGARQGSKIALAAYLASYNAAKPNDRQFEVERMVSLAEYITQVWPKEAETDEAWMLLGDVAIRENNLEQAAEYLGKVPETSPRRGEADLKAGQALWGTYLSASRLPAEERKDIDLPKLSQQAQEILERGVSRMREAVTDPSEVNYTLLASELSLAQIYIGSGQADKAVALLETPTSGILALVEARSEVVAKGNFCEEAYKAALRAYVGNQQMEKAEGAMKALDAYVESQPGGDQAALTRIYISLGRELEEQVQALQSDPTKKEALNATLKGFETFLSNIGTRKEGNTFNSLSWVGETFFRLGSGLDTGETASEQAKDYYLKASKTYDNMFAQVAKDPTFAPNAEAVTSLEVRLSMCERRLGHHKEALDRLTKILQKNERLLEAQRQAAYTYEEWARQNPGYFLNAMLGGRKNPATGRNLVWGWHTMSAMVQNNPNKDISDGMFHEARYNLAHCRYQHAMSLSGADKTEKLKLARGDIGITYRLRPSMGEKYQWKEKYEKLLQDVQKELGEEPAGLSAFDAQPAGTAASAASSR